MLHSLWWHLVALYITVDVWLFHKATEIEDYIARRN